MICVGFGTYRWAPLEPGFKLGLEKGMKEHIVGGVNGSRGDMHGDHISCKGAEHILLLVAALMRMETEKATTNLV